MIHIALTNLAKTTTDLRGEPIEGAQCRFDPELHTGPDALTEETPEDREVREAVAIGVCETCPLRQACFEYAVATLPEFGIWAGFTAEEIAALAIASLGEVA
ncbi:WhiB family transcriptional regulator [Spirillospora sp. NPDC048911]|uniref:WhiB family transcriptional regulator n=1 Tax=Spirillospora sp. NPDC048911 TaxID=3364527 RepID=UPI00372278F6